MPEDFDVVIVGARCAGSSLAIRLARAGLSVCVVDRAVFPSDTPSTHAIQASGVAALDELGARQEAEATTTPVTRAFVALGSARAHVEDLPALLGAPMLNVRRVTLDAILVNQAASVGADVRCDISVTGLEVAANGRVTGVKTTTGPITARLVVGADAIRSTIAKHVGAREYAATDPGRAFAWGYLSDFDLNASDVSATVWIGKPDVNGYLASQTDAGLFMAVASVDLARKPEFLRDREAAYKASFAEWPELGAVVSSGTLVGPVRLMSGWHGFFRESAGPGWALVGDAGHFKDPTPGQGISDALRQTRQLASTIEAAMGGTTQLDEALRGYWQWRDDDAWPMYW